MQSSLLFTSLIAFGSSANLFRVLWWSQNRTQWHSTGDHNPFASFAPFHFDNLSIAGVFPFSCLVIYLFTSLMPVSSGNSLTLYNSFWSYHTFKILLKEIFSNYICLWQKQSQIPYNSLCTPKNILAAPHTLGKRVAYIKRQAQ